MNRKRLWEIGATAVLLLAVAVAVGGFFAWRERQRRLDRELAGLLAPEMETSYGRCDRMLVLLRRGACVRVRGRSGWRLIHAAAATDHLPLLREALLRGEDPDAAGRKGITPLGLAIAIGNINSTRLLLEHGADPMQRNDYGDTALEYGEIWGGSNALPVVRFVKQHGAKE
jgi:ankyrin repeat protein